jgi:endonuclease YncB( thermonuclease family)
MVRVVLRLILALTLIGATVSGATADSLRGLVVGVADGDTVTVLTGQKTRFHVRLLGIDAPEKSQDYGQRSKQSLSGLVYMKEVDVEYEKTDRYGRLLGRITVGGKDANLAQVSAGMAWHYKQYERAQGTGDRLAYAEAERSARAGKVGLWEQAWPTPPWEFRREERR